MEVIEGKTTGIVTLKFTDANGNTSSFEVPSWTAFLELKDMVEAMNGNISTLQTVVENLQNNVYVTSVEKIDASGNVLPAGSTSAAGYRINFSSGDPIDIYHGTNGTNGTMPEVNVSIKADTDGVLYWALNGEWMLDENGNKVPAAGVKGDQGDQGAQGEQGKAPIFKIVDGKWYYMNGAGVMQTGWVKLGDNWYYFAHSVTCSIVECCTELRHVDSSRCQRWSWFCLSALELELADFCNFLSTHKTYLLIFLCLCRG